MCRRLGVRGLGPALCQGFRLGILGLIVGTVVGQSRPLALSFLLVEFSEVSATAAGEEVAGGEREGSSDIPDVFPLAAHVDYLRLPGFGVNGLLAPDWLLAL